MTMAKAGVEEWRGLELLHFHLNAHRCRATHTAAHTGPCGPAECVVSVANIRDGGGGMLLEVQGVLSVARDPTAVIQWPGVSSWDEGEGAF